MRITLNTPTRNRPQRLQAMWESALNLADEPDKLDIVLYIDLDDYVSQAHLKIMQEMWPNQIDAVIGPRIMLSEMHNKIYEKTRGEITQCAGDDTIFRTQSWDTMVRNKFNEFPDKIAFVYGSDGFQPDTFGTHGALHKNWIETTGYLAAPYFSAAYTDTWLNDVSAVIGRHCYIPIMIEHMHYSAGKSEVDIVYQEATERVKRDDPGRLYYSREMTTKRHEDAQKLQEFINAFQKN